MRWRFSAWILVAGAGVGVYVGCSDVSFENSAAGSSSYDRRGGGSGPGDGNGPPVGEPPPGCVAPCSLEPLVSRPGVVTILLALGDQVNDSLVVSGGSSQLIAESVVRYASPKVNPKILVVRDRNHNNESAYDPQFIALELLRRYQTHFIDEPTGGLLASHVAAYDVVWFNNPGHPMGSQVSRDTLQSFPGGVILSGDDLTRGQGFSMEALTGLRHVSNGTSVRCAGNDFPHDNNSAHRYSVTMDPTKFPVSDASHMVFDYGNDIDDSLPNGGVEVMAVAVGGHPSCVAERPVIVRYPK